MRNQEHKTFQNLSRSDFRVKVDLTVVTLFSIIFTTNRCPYCDLLSIKEHKNVTALISNASRKMVKVIWIVGLVVLSMQLTSSWKYDRRKFSSYHGGDE